MNTYKIETTITDDGKIILPSNLKNLFSHKIEIFVLDKESNKIKNTSFGIYDFSGQFDNVNIKDLAHEDK